MKPGSAPFETVLAEASALGIPIGELPRKWEKVGDVLILRFPPQSSHRRESIAGIYARALRVRTVVEDLAGIHGPWRVPEVRRLWGDGTETVHVENGVSFKLDVARVMFSSGNLEERVQMSRAVHPGETVVDLFAGIGYFSLPIAVHGKAARIVACEVNPIAFHYLEEGIRLNRAAAVEARIGDSRDVAPVGIADRVIMGHFDAGKYVDVAFRAAADAATIHVHGLLRFQGPKKNGDPLQGDSSRQFLEEIRDSGNRHRFEVTDAQARFVKWYGPHRAHVVADVSARRT